MIVAVLGYEQYLNCKSGDDNIWSWTLPYPAPPAPAAVAVAVESTEKHRRVLLQHDDGAEDEEARIRLVLRPLPLLV